MSLDYNYILERRKRNEAMSEKKTVSLSEQARRKERAESEKWRLDLENKLRESKGEPPLEKLADLKEDPVGMPHSTEIVEDSILLEAEEILTDFIELLRKKVAYQ